MIQIGAYNSPSLKKIVIDISEVYETLLSIPADETVFLADKAIKVISRTLLRLAVEMALSMS